MNELQTRILNSAREAVAKKHGYESWHHVEGVCRSVPEIMVIDKEAALLAMEKQAEFFRWATLNGYVYSGKDKWRRPFHSGLQTELELYEIWEGQK